MALNAKYLPFPMQKNDPKIIRAWAFYDWANSVYPLVITSTLFPIYYTAVTTNQGSDMLSFLGMSFKNTALYTYAMSFAYLLIAAIAPLLSGIADYGGKKKGFMMFFCYLGAIACSSMALFTGLENLWIGVLTIVLACIGYSGSIVFYNAYLPEIATPDRQDKVSAKGYALGYIGGALLLIFNLILIMMPEVFYNIPEKISVLMQADTNLNEESAKEQVISQLSGISTRISFFTTGIWWIVFAHYSFYYLPKNVFNRKPKGNLIGKGYQELLKVWQELKSNPTLKRYLAAFFIFNMGVQTVMLVATLFGSKELKLESGELILTILIIQFVAIGGAYLFSWSSGKWGNIIALRAATLIWIGICITAYFVYSAVEFYVLAFFVGLVMGGIQSLSRSTYSKLLPETINHASYFSFYDICEKLGIVLGMAIFGFIEEISDSMRNSVIALFLFFLIGFLLLLRINNALTLQHSTKK
jgi:MFS transporter, UMF1 family